MKKWLVVSLLGLSGVAMAADPAAHNAMPAASELSDSMMQENSATTDNAAAIDATAAEATSTEAAAANDAVTEQAGFSRGSVIRSVFTTAVQEREPVDKLNNTEAEQERVFYFTELRDMSGQTAIHRWEKEGNVMAEVKFDVRGPRWRVWSSKSFQPTSAGEWKVSVLNGAGEIIAEETLNLKAVSSGNASEAAAENALSAETAPMEQPATQEFETPVNENLIQ